MSSFTETVKTLNSKFKKCSTYSIWIELTLYHTNSDKIIISTAKKDNYIIQVQNQKNGTGLANNITIDLGYMPTLKNGTYNVDYIDKILCSKYGTLCNFDLRYGYSFEGSYNHVQTILYSGIITNYTVEVRNGLLTYHLTATSTLINNLEDKYNFETKENMRCTDVAVDVLKNYVKGYTIEFDDGVEGTDCVLETVDGATDSTVFDYVKTLLGSAIHKSQANIENIDIKDKITYNFIIEESNKKRIRITKFDPKSIKQDELLVFNWMDKGNNLVVDFSFNFNGSILMSSSYLDKTSVRIALDSEGNEILTTTSGSAIKASSDISAKKNTWAQAVNNLAYTASLTMIGLPCEVQIGTYVKIIPLIYGEAHMSAGYYLIQKMTDNISTSGYLTTIELMRIGMYDSDFNGVDVYNLSTDRYETDNGTYARQSNYIPNVENQNKSKTVLTPEKPYRNTVNPIIKKNGVYENVK